MLTEVKSRKKISEIISKKIDKKGIDKSLLAKKCEISRSTIYQSIQNGKYNKSYSIDTFLKICNELGVKIYIEY